MTRSRFARRCAAALVASAALAAPLTAPTLASAHGAGGWGDPFRISPQAGIDTGICGGPATAVDADGGVTYVWCQMVPFGSQERPVLQSRVYYADGTAGEPQTLTDPSAPGFLSDFRIATDGSDTVHVALLRQLQSCTPFCAFGYALEHFELDGDGQLAGAPTPIASAAVGAAQVGYVELAVNASGEALIGWSEYDYSDNVTDAKAVRIDAAGSVGSALDLSEGVETASPISVALADDGSAFAAWSTYGSSESDDGGVSGRAIEADDTLAPVRTLAPADRYVEGIRAVIDQTGKGTAVVWQHADGGGLDVLARQVSADGAVVGAEPATVAPGSEQPSLGDVAIAGTGAVTIAWSEGMSPYHLRTRVLDPSGALGPENELTTDGDWNRPLLALNADGSGRLVAAGYDGVTGLETVHAFEIVSDGTSAHAPEPIGTERSEYNSLYPADLDGNGHDLAVAWAEDIDELDFEAEAFGSIFDGTAPDVSVWAPAKAVAGSPIVVAAEGSDRNALSYAWSFGDGATGKGLVAQHAYAAPGTYTVAVTATDSEGNASTAKATVQVTKEATGDSGNVKDTTPPDTRIVAGPNGPTRNRRPRFRFVASEPKAAFECKLDRGRWRDCESPLRVKKLRYGKHKLQVRAVDAAGNADRFPDSRQFRVVKPKRKRGARR